VETSKKSGNGVYLIISFWENFRAHSPDVPT